MCQTTLRPNPRGETCPHCGGYDTLVTSVSWNTPMSDGTIRCCDCIRCYNCGLEVYVGWVAKNPTWRPVTSSH